MGHTRSSGGEFTKERSSPPVSLTAGTAKEGAEVAICQYCDRAGSRGGVEWVWLLLCKVFPACLLVPLWRGMDRTYWVEANDFLPGEKVVAQQATVRLYDGEDKVLKKKKKEGF